MTTSLAPTSRHVKQSRHIVDAAARHGAEVVHALVDRLEPGDVPIIIGLLARRCVGVPEVAPTPAAGRMGRPRLDDAVFTYDEAKRARTAYTRGDRSERVVMGNRAYKRMRQAISRAAVERLNHNTKES